MRVLLLVAAGLLLAGCADSKGDPVDRATTPSYLRNDSDVPITYHILDGGEATLPPGEEVTDTGGAWMAPRGYYCTWSRGEGSPPRGVGTPEYDTWTTFTGFTEIIESCTPM